MDRELVRSAMAGDREAFDVLASAALGRLYAVASLILRDPHPTRWVRHARHPAALGLPPAVHRLGGGRLSRAYR